MRTTDEFSKVYQDAQFTCNLHQNKKVWIVPTDCTYVLSVIKPRPDGLPEGTSSVSCEVVDGEFVYAEESVRSTN